MLANKYSLRDLQSQRREYYTSVVRNCVGADTDIEHLPRMLWYNWPNVYSLHMTFTGMNMLSSIAFCKFHLVELNKPLSSKMILQMERLFDQPYVIAPPKGSAARIHVAGDQLTVMLHLYDGDLSAFLHNLETQLDQ